MRIGHVQVSVLIVESDVLLVGTRLEHTYLIAPLVKLTSTLALLDTFSSYEDPVAMMTAIRQCMEELSLLIMQAGAFGIHAVGDPQCGRYIDLVRNRLIAASSKATQREYNRRQFYTLLYQSLEETKLLESLLPLKGDAVQQLAETCKIRLGELYEYIKRNGIQLDNQNDSFVVNKIFTALLSVQITADRKFNLRN